MAIIKTQPQYKNSDNLFKSINFNTKGTLAIRDTNNLPITGTNAEECIQSMANLFFPPYGTQFTYAFTPTRVGWMNLIQNEFDPSVIVGINAYENGGEYWYTFNSGQHWESKTTNYVAQTKLACITPYYENSLPVINGYCIYLINTDNAGSQNISNGNSVQIKLLRTTTESLASITYATLNNIGAPYNDHYYTAICNSPTKVYVFDDIAETVGIYDMVSNSLSWIRKTFTDIGATNVHSAMYNKILQRIILGSDEGYLVSPLENEIGTGIVTKLTLDNSTYGNLINMSQDDLGNLYLLTEKQLRVINRDDILTNVGTDIVLPLLTSETENWQGITIQNNTIIVLGSLGSIAIMPVNTLTSDAWRITSTNFKTTPCRCLAQGSGGNLIYSLNKGTVGGKYGTLDIYDTFTTPPTNIY